MYINETIEWKNPTGFIGWISKTDIEIYKNLDKYLIVATDRKDSQGMSITNGAEYFWGMISTKYSLDPNKCTRVESYRHTERTYDQVAFTSRGDAVWRKISNFNIFMSEFFNLPIKESRLKSIK